MHWSRIRRGVYERIRKYRALEAALLTAQAKQTKSPIQRSKRSICPWSIATQAYCERDDYCRDAYGDRRRCGVASNYFLIPRAAFARLPLNL